MGASERKFHRMLNIRNARSQTKKEDRNIRHKQIRNAHNRNTSAKLIAARRNLLYLQAQ